MEWSFYLSKIEETVKNIIIGFFVFSVSVMLVVIIVFYLSLMLSFNNIFLSLFMFGLLAVINYIGKQIRTKLNDSDGDFI